MLRNSFAHAISHLSLVFKPQLCHQTFWRWHGTYYFLGHPEMPGAIPCLDPDGRLVQKKLQPTTMK